MSKLSILPSTRKRILVTGGAGTIGSATVRLLSLSHEVIVVDNLSSGSLNFLPNNNNIHTSVFDIRDTDKLDALFQSVNIDIVVHLAAHFANQNSVDFPMTDQSVNIQGTLALLERCKIHGSSFVYASSSCVYGQKSGKLKEDLPIDDLHTPYAISKYCGELYVKFYANYFKVPSIALRFFNNFGPCENPGQYRNVIPNFISKAMRGEKLVVTGSGEETRDFNYVENTARAVQLATEACLQNMLSFGVFNVGTGHETKIIDLAKKIKALTSSSSEIELVGKRRSWDHSLSRCADIDAISNTLGYKANVGIDEGLSRTVEWFEKNPSIWNLSN